MRRSHRPPGHHGFVMLEALIALFVLAFGMLSIAGVQIVLSRSGDVAKQRSEATRLAEQQMERMRAFEQVAAASGKVAYADMATGSDIPTTTTNTTYARTWTVSGTPRNIP